MKDSVIISTGFGRLHLYYAALAAQDSGLLHSMITTLYLRKAWLPWAERIAQFGSKRLRKLLLHRDPGIDECRVVSLILPDLFCRLSNYITKRGCPESIQFFLDRAASEIYGSLAARYINPPVKLIHSRSGFSRNIIPKAYEIGAKVLLEQSAAHPDFVINILEEEYEKWGVPLNRRTKVRPVEEMRKDICNADFILTNSDFCASTIYPYVDNPENIKIVYTGVETDIFLPQEKKYEDSTFQILFVGGISTFKGVVYLINAFKKLKLKDAKLILIGNYHPDCSEVVRKLRDFYEYIPFVPHQDMPFQYLRASVFAFPSLAEGSARVVSEAMSCGLPCIVTPNAGSIIKDGIDGFIVPPQDENALAEKILYFYENRNLMIEMGRAARESAVNNLTWEHYGQNLLKVYEDIIKSC